MMILQLDSNQLDKLIQGAVKKALAETSSNSLKESHSDQLLTIDEAAQFLTLKKATIYSMVQRREIPVNKRGNRLYFSKAELIKWVKDGRKMTNKDLDQASFKFISNRKGRR